MKEEELSDLVWLGRRLDKVLTYLIKTQSNFKDPFLKYVDEYFIPIINGIKDQEEDYYYEEMDSIVDELEDILSQTFENKIIKNK